MATITAKTPLADIGSSLRATLGDIPTLWTGCTRAEHAKAFGETVSRKVLECTHAITILADAMIQQQNQIKELKEQTGAGMDEAAVQA